MLAGVEVQLADGNTYVFPPLALGSLELMQEKLSAFRGGAIDAESIKTVVSVAMHSLRRNYPALTRKDVVGVCHEDENGDIVWDKPGLLDVGNMKEVMDAVMDISGLKRKEQEAEKARASNPL